MILSHTQFPQPHRILLVKLLEYGHGILFAFHNENHNAFDCSATIIIIEAIRNQHETTNANV